MGVDFPDRRVLATRVVDGRKPASGHESRLRQGVASGHPQGRSAAKEPQSGLTRRNPLTFDPTCCGFSHSLFAIYARFYAAANIPVVPGAPARAGRTAHALQRTPCSTRPGSPATTTSGNCSAVWRLHTSTSSSTPSSGKSRRMAPRRPGFYGQLNAHAIVSRRSMHRGTSLRRWLSRGT